MTPESGFVRRLWYAMFARAWTPTRLETEAQFSKGYLSKIFSGDRGDRIDREHLEKIAKHLDVSLDYLILNNVPPPRATDPYPERFTVARNMLSMGVSGRLISELYKPKYAKSGHLRKAGWQAEMATIIAEAYVAGDEDAKRAHMAKVHRVRPKRAPAPTTEEPDIADDIAGKPQRDTA